MPPRLPARGRQPHDAAQTTRPWPSATRQALGSTPNVRSRATVTTICRPRAGTSSNPIPQSQQRAPPHKAKGRRRWGLAARSSDRTGEGPCSAQRPAPDASDQRTVCLSTASPHRVAPICKSVLRLPRPDPSQADPSRPKPSSAPYSSKNNFARRTSPGNF